MCPVYCMDTTVHCTVILIHFHCVIQQVVYILLHYGGAQQRIWLVKAFQRTAGGLLRACLCVRADQLEKVRQGRCKFFSTGAKVSGMLQATMARVEKVGLNFSKNFSTLSKNGKSSPYNLEAGLAWPEIFQFPVIVIQ
ncbi:uncharacterized protein LOC129601670 [Paramacrobiotus metropolitanus]|uniref:uncharacterized protein LOC129601670 n=1 Tax=Paramacrobiotus metropolitanus TaxID=2943436 RepID=UPI0024456D11|nr:uncharacterized protein LOC129601670 [Paramacrobiotus metropolitanus]